MSTAPLWNASRLVQLVRAFIRRPFVRDVGVLQLGTVLRIYLIPGFWVVIPATTILALQATRRIWQLTWLENGMNVLTAIGGVAGALVSATAALVLVGQAAAAALSGAIGAITYQ